jgi:hypothetical protein
VAYELWHRQRRAYSCDREPHVADDKEPDIRLQARAAPASVPVEIKLAERWSLTELEMGLQEQLCGRYLRAPGCRYGVYLLAHLSPRANGWITGGGELLSFPQVLIHLQAIADRIAGEDTDSPQVQVCAIDVSEL